MTWGFELTKYAVRVTWTHKLDQQGVNDNVAVAKRVTIINRPISKVPSNSWCCLAIVANYKASVLAVLTSVWAVVYLTYTKGSPQTLCGAVQLQI